MSFFLIPTNRMALWLSSKIEKWLAVVDIKQGSWLEEIIYSAIIIVVAILIGWAIRKVVVWLLRNIFSRHPSPFIKTLLEQRIINKSSHIIPPLVFLTLIPFAFEADVKTLLLIERGVIVYFLIVLGWTICSVLNIIWFGYSSHKKVKNLPLKGILNLAKGIVWIIIVIVAVSVIMHRSPAALLTGLGAFAAALMLIFKDSILGFVAGIQLSTNDMLRVGDWIAVPGTIANGIVIDVSLTAVKVRNWDNTTVTLPPYTLVSTSLQNYNKMQQRGQRHIDRSLFIDPATVQPTTLSMLEQFKQIPYMDGYITQNLEWAKQGKGTSLARGQIKVNGSINTNLGCFRAYVSLYLRHHPWIAVDSIDCLVYLQEQTVSGIPLHLFCYTNTTDWFKFEGIQSDIFENLIAMAPAFGLKAYAAPTAQSVVKAGSDKSMKNMPYNDNIVAAAPAYVPETNYMVPPNMSGDFDMKQSSEAVYPSIPADTASPQAPQMPLQTNSNSISNNTAV
ncbi:mechanosensitive ion channel family protein [Muribaculum caecicola]|uniref:Mechanosensitive ion channel n=2 Tax=Muribaculum TaxID=1918540 RepID=A0AC61S5W1_9BACT|nr:mechanosensitive ion channel domain-containing protein [Muribaculum caecicola]THG51655.1 mechanosensitive ion channel [Muribaculum caecicola]